MTSLSEAELREKIIELREEKGLTFKQIAMICDVSTSYVQQIYSRNTPEESHGRDTVIYNRQRKRQEKYPKDRICFLSTWKAAKADADIFDACSKGDLPIEIACDQVALNNYLDYVTEEQLLNELRIIGKI